MPNYYSKKNAARNKRADHSKAHRQEFERNRRKILLTQTVCGICGQEVDKKLKYPHPMSATVDHIIPISKGGHPSDIDNLQLAHFTCNRAKSDKLDINPPAEPPTEYSGINTILGLNLSINWMKFHDEPQQDLREEVLNIESQGLILTARGKMKRK